jgi:acyl-coenzyme A thioesterase PaaI-like protein
MIQTPDFSQMRFRPFREDDALLASLGTVCLADNGTDLVLRLDCGVSAVNPGGFVHGGATAALFDVALYEAAKAARREIPGGRQRAIAASCRRAEPEGRANHGDLCRLRFPGRQDDRLRHRPVREGRFPLGLQRPIEDNR